MAESSATREGDAPEVVDDWEVEFDDSNDTATVQNPTTNPVALTEHGNATTADAEKDEEDGDTDTDTDAEFEDHRSQIFSDYRKLLSRRVDLVGDYAGNELFIIDGDSLLLHCFSDERLDFDHGFQLLHAVFNVEHFLHQLVKRKCNFHVGFFTANKKLCVPPTAKAANASKYLLARAVIIRHLKTNLSGPVEVYEFASYTSHDFEEYLLLHAPYFVMAHDGALTTSFKDNHVASEDEDCSMLASRAALRDMILWFVTERGLNVALVNGLETRDSKVITVVLERRDRSVKTPNYRNVAQEPARVDSIQFEADLTRLRSYAPQLTERQCLAVLATKHMLASQLSDISDQKLNSLANAFLVHQAILAHIPLSIRRLPIEADSEAAQTFLQVFATHAESILCATTWISDTKMLCDVADLLDGRLYLQICKRSYRLSPQVQKELDGLLSALNHLVGRTMSGDEQQDAPVAQPISNGQDTSLYQPTNATVLPFSNPVFDKHMASIKLDIDGHTADLTPNSHRIFQEVSHWHNAKKPLIVKGGKGATPAQTAKQAFWKAKKDQLFAAEVQKYAASLTNAVGRSLEPESIIVGSSKPKTVVPSSSSGRATPDSDSTDSSSSVPKNKPQPKKGGKKAQPNAGKQAMLNQIAASKAKKDESASDKIVAAWHVVCRGIELDNDPKSRYAKAHAYLSSLPSASRSVVSSEVELYALSSLLQYLATLGKSKTNRYLDVAALVWSTCQDVLQSGGMTSEIVTHVQETLSSLSLPPVPVGKITSLPSRRLGFTFTKPKTASVDLDATSFQLRHAGPYLERSFDSRPDPRVDFEPDGWQRRVLDAIDLKQSVFVVAPTSAGKTFISFYAMRKVLETDDDGVLVYVAPTKALVNQIAAEIQARYSKKFKYGGKSVWAIHTRDYRINNPTGCQVLVTVPHVLQIMLLAPTNANSWSGRVKRIIFDEVHSIGQAEDGVVWEQLLLLAPCPIIALSATVGNPGEFSEWLSTTQRAIGNELVTVQHPYRYSDLRKYYYSPPQQFSFQGLPTHSLFGTLGLEHSPGLNPIHPVAALVDRSHGVPEDLALEPQDCLELYNALVKHSNERYPMPQDLDPKIALPAGPLKKVDILHWERQLKAVLERWIEDRASPYDNVLKDLERSFRTADRETLQTSRSDNTVAAVDVVDEPLSSTLPLLCRLHEQNALPAIFFNYDRLQCEDIARSILNQLQAAEEAQIKSGPKWEKKLERWEEWKKVQEKLLKGAKALAKKGASSKGEDATDEKSSKLDQQRETGSAEASSWDSFDPDAPVDGYHFADHSKVLPSEMEIYIRQLKRREIQQWLIDALKRGVGIHHAGMNRKYRQICEILFRKKFLTIVIATGTLAMGINMPAKTVVFSGDSVFLTALNFRQCAGRAGRRGFDLLGNVIFQGISREKVCRLISSRLPDLNGHFPITTTLSLRLFTLLSESNNSKYAVSAINALLSQPRLYMGGPSFKDQTMHHLRFSIEYLRRQHLLSASGAPLNFAGLVSHLYFTENSAFAFHALLKEGYFHELCAGIEDKEKDTLETLMLVMANLFNRRPCRPADAEVVKRSSSIVFLPPLPKKATTILRDHNQQTLNVYQTYVETFVDQHITTDDRTLPLTGIEIGTSSVDAEMDISEDVVHHLPTTKMRSSFVALSGLGDNFESISALCQTTREGVFLEEAVIPYVDVEADKASPPLNAWLLDFYKHGDVYTIERANGIRRSEIWFMLNDFSLVLATLIASLMGYMKLREGTDMDMLEVIGNMDAHEEAEDEQATVSEEQSSDAGASIADSGISLPERPKQVSKAKAKNADSWEDVADEEEAAMRKEDRRAAQAGNAEGGGTDGAWSGEQGKEGLKVILKAFTKLHAEFTIKFRAMWA